MDAPAQPGKTASSLAAQACYSFINIDTSMLTRTSRIRADRFHETDEDPRFQQSLENHLAKTANDTFLKMAREHV
jgi:hypothetical protein